MIKWDVVLANQTKGRLDIGSLDAFNNVVLFKWKWCHNNNDVWCKVIKALHGQDGLNQVGVILTTGV